MKKYILIAVAVLFSMESFAHNPNVSTTILVEKENNVWVLQIRASLTAFQQEVKTQFSETPYKSPEDFKEMVLEHIKNNFQLYFNGSKNVTLSNGMVQLGHETNVVFEVSGIPSELHSVEITNTVFEDIHKSQSSLMLLKENFKKNQFILNDANNHNIFLTVVKNEFVEEVVARATFFSSNVWFVLLGLIGLGVLFQIGYKRS